MASNLMGFVIQVFAGRAGLFTATVLPTSGGAPVAVQVSDLDGEPERFNERLTKVRLFREAMSRAEPVVVVYEFDPKTNGNEVESVQCLTRDHLLAGMSEQDVTGFVTGVRVREQHGTVGSAVESSDVVDIRLTNPAGLVTPQISLALQRAERTTTAAMLALFEDAFRHGEPVTARVLVGMGDNADAWVVSVGRTKVGTDLEPVDGFVEVIGTGALFGVPFADVAMTTAPKFTSEQHTLDPSFFHPTQVKFLVPEGSRMLGLLNDSLRRGLRVRVALQGGNPKGDSPNDYDARDAAPGSGTGVMDVKKGLLSKEAFGGVFVALHVDLLAPLASAVRPVWVRARKEALDAPPEAECIFPVPATDLSPAGVASLQVPHRAAWEGTGCFNHGVYRIQVVSPVEPRVLINGKVQPCAQMMPGPAKDVDSPPASKEELLEKGYREVKLIGGLAPAGGEFAAPKPKVATYHVHACLHELNTIRVELDEWRCKYPFHIDVFKVV